MNAEIVDRGRGPQIAGTRITVYDIMDYLTEGWGVASIATWLRISSVKVQAAIDYIQQHKAEVEAEYQRMLDRDAQGNPPEIQAKLEESHRKLQALLAQRKAAKSEVNGERNSGGPQQ